MARRGKPYSVRKSNMGRGRRKNTKGTDQRLANERMLGIAEAMREKLKGKETSDEVTSND